MGMFNRYKYAANNPYKFTDPDGRYETTTGSRIPGGGAGNNVSVIQVAAGNISPRNARERLDKAQRYLDAVGPALEKEVRDTPKDSAKLFKQVFQKPGARLGVEFGARIVPSEYSIVGWQLTELAVSQFASAVTGLGYTVLIRSVEGGYDVHTHPQMSTMSKWFHPFSPGDARLTRQYKLNSFVIQPDGSTYLLSDGSHPEKVE